MSPKYVYFFGNGADLKASDAVNTKLMSTRFIDELKNGNKEALEIFKTSCEANLIKELKLGKDRAYKFLYEYLLKKYIYVGTRKWYFTKEDTLDVIQETIKRILNISIHMNLCLVLNTGFTKYSLIVQ